MGDVSGDMSLASSLEPSNASVIASIEAINTALLPAGLTIEGIVLRLLGLIPGVIGHQMLRQRIKRLEQFSKEMNKRFASVEIRMDADSLAFLIEKSMRVAIEDHRDFKRGMLAAILGDAAGTEGDQVSISRHFIDMVDAMEPQHLALLRCLKRAKAEKHEQETQTRCMHYDGLRAALPPIEEGGVHDRDSLTFATVNFLLGNGLVGSASDPSKKHSMVTGGMNPSFMWSRAVYFLTPLGQRFVKYLEEPTSMATC